LYSLPLFHKHILQQLEEVLQAAQQHQVHPEPMMGVLLTVQEEAFELHWELQWHNIYTGLVFKFAQASAFQEQQITTEVLSSE